MYTSGVIENNFFVITYDNCNNIKSRLYGYAILDNKIIINKSDNNLLPYDCAGTYINIVKKDKVLYIQNDLFAGMDLYIYRNSNYFAISNSFLYLVKNLNNKYKLNENNNFIDLAYSIEITTLSMCASPVKEIERLLPYSLLSIDLESRKVNIKKYDFITNNISLDSQECFDLLDSWQRKYNNIVKNIIEQGRYISIDLSGGMDTRVAFSLIANLNLNSKDVRIRSLEDGLHTHKEDLDIASRIAEKFNFQLNCNPDKFSYLVSMTDSLLIQFYVKLFYHSQYQKRKYYCRNGRFNYTGFGGECFRNYWNMSKEEFYERKVKFNYFNEYDFLKKAIKQLNYEFKEVLKISNNKLPEAENLFIYTYSRNHFKKIEHEWLISNYYPISPLYDPQLFKIYPFEYMSDKNILYAVILDRYVPKLNDIPFDSGRVYSNELWNAAKLLNKKYPKKDKLNEYYEINTENSYELNKYEGEDTDQSQYLYELFKTDTIKEFICSKYGKDFYRYADNFYKRNNYFSDNFIIKCISSYILENILRQKDTELLPLPKICNYCPSSLLKQIFSNFLIARLDIFFESESNKSIEIIDCSDVNAYIINPEWYKKENGIGTLIESFALKLKLKVLAPSQGCAYLYFRSRDFDIEDNKIIYIIDINNINIKLNGNIFYEDNEYKAVKAYKPFVLQVDSFSNDIIEINFEWQPHDYTFPQLLQIINKFYM